MQNGLQKSKAGSRELRDELFLAYPVWLFINAASILSIENTYCSNHKKEGSRSSFVCCRWETSKLCSALKSFLVLI